MRDDQRSLPKQRASLMVHVADLDVWDSALAELGVDDLLVMEVPEVKVELPEAVTQLSPLPAVQADVSQPQSKERKRQHMR